MKKLLFLILCACALFVKAQAQKEKNTFVIEGSIKDMPVPPGMVYLSYDTTGYMTVDSARVKNGHYAFRGSLDRMRHLVVSIMDLDSRHRAPGMISTVNMTAFYLEKGNVRIVSTGTMDHSVVTGSPPEDEYRMANKRYDLVLDSLRQLVRMGQEMKNDVMVQVALRSSDRLMPIVKADYPAFIRSHPDAQINLTLIQQLMPYSETAGWMDQLDSLYHLLPLSLRSGREGQRMGEKLAGELKTAIGHKAVDFTQQDTEGRPVSLSSFKGKYVLLDFWASTDPNCSRALPILVKAHETFGSKGLVVLGVSLDEDKDAWLKMIQETGSGQITQVSDLKGKENEAARLYGITAVPKNLLIDPNGIIIARNLTSITLDKTLTSIFE